MYIITLIYFNVTLISLVKGEAECGEFVSQDDRCG